MRSSGRLFTFIRPDGTQREGSRDGAMDSIQRWHRGFENYRYDISYEAAVDDTAVFFTTFSGTHTGTFHWLYLGPREPTGKTMACYQSFAFGVSDGRITTMRSVWDQTHLALQLGVAAGGGANPKTH